MKSSRRVPRPLSVVKLSGMHYSKYKNFCHIAGLLALCVGASAAQVYHPPSPDSVPDSGPRPYTVVNGVSAPTLLRFISAVPTKEAQEARAHGTVVLWGIVAPDGRYVDVKIARSLGMGLDLAAVSSVRDWKFKPGEKDRRPVPVAIFLGVYFDTVGGITGGTLDCHPNKLTYEDVCSSPGP